MADIVKEGSATAPTAGAAIVTTGALSPGRYLASVSGMLTGTVVAATDVDNIQLQVGATVVGVDLLVPVTATAFANPPVEVQVPEGGAAVTVNAVAGGSVAAVYNVQLVVKTLAVYP